MCIHMYNARSAFRPAASVAVGLNHPPQTRRAGLGPHGGPSSKSRLFQNPTFADTLVMDSSKRKYPVSLMLDHDRHEMLRAARERRFSMSEVVRASVDRMMREIGYPENPDWEALDRAVNCADD